MTFRNKDRRILYSESLLWESIWNDIRKMTPREAASLMGYKAIENCLTTDACNQENTENARVQSEEANMDKPRICEILGVEPRESFYIQGFDKTEFWIMDDGTFATRPSNAPDSTRALLQALDHPERIIRKPRFTEQEVADAKTLCRMWPNGEIKFTRATDGDCTMVQVQGSLRGCLGLGTVDLFPSIKPGQSYILNKIAGGDA